MMMMSVLPVMADHVIGKPAGVCPGAGHSPWKMVDTLPGTEDNDKNGNGHICHNARAVAIFMDDRIPKN